MTQSHPFAITLLGTGCPVVSPRRYGAGTLVQCGGMTVLVDIGSGVTQRLVEAGSSGAEIDALLITHIHSDHLVDCLVVAPEPRPSSGDLRSAGYPETR